MQPLHDHNLMTTGQIVQARSHGAVPPFHCGAAFGCRAPLTHRRRIIPPHVIPALASPRRHRHNYPVASSGIFEAVLLVLVAAELVPNRPSAPDTNPIRSSDGI